MNFADIIGHKELVDNLRKMVDDRKLPHAMLFSEQPGCGALSIVLALTQYLFCKKRNGADESQPETDGLSLFGEAEPAPKSEPVSDACDHCSSCLKIRDLSHSDFHLVFPINTTKLVENGKKVPIDLYHELFRTLVKKNPYFKESDLYKEMGLENKLGLIGVSEANWIINRLSFSAYEGGSKVVLIMFPERMNAEAANKLLKSIEEPTPDTFFFLITNAPGKIIKTIRSRCRLVAVTPIEKEELASTIEKKLNIDEEEAVKWAAVAQGSYGRAIELINECDEENENFSDIISLFTLAKERNLAEMLELGADLASRGKEAQKSFCISALKILRESYMSHIGIDRIYCSPNRREDIERLGKALHKEFFQKGYEMFNNAVECIERNVNAKFIFTDLCDSLYINIQ